MSQLIQIRQRIKAVETIKKVTHAMRLISMSTHSHLRQQFGPLKEYIANVHALYARTQAGSAYISQWATPSIQTAPVLCIVVGSQKGLVGNFNTMLFTALSDFCKVNDPHSLQFIGIGKQAVDYLHHHYQFQVKSTYQELSIRNAAILAEELANIIFMHAHQYKKIVMISNEPRTFFIQKPITSTLFPFATPKTDTSFQLHDYTWYQSREDILDILVKQSIRAQCEFLLFQSLMAENAARFISMDSSTRNAEQLLETTRLAYNKLRQAKITKEISELTGSI